MKSPSTDAGGWAYCGLQRNGVGAVPRVGISKGADLWQMATLYDVQDEDDVGAAIAWAWETANELAPTELSAELWGVIILERCKRWHAWLCERPLREESRRATINARKAAARASAQLVADLRESRFWWSTAAFALGSFLTTVLWSRKSSIRANASLFRTPSLRSPLNPQDLSKGS